MHIVVAGMVMVPGYLTLYKHYCHLAYATFSFIQRFTNKAFSSFIMKLFQKYKWLLIVLFIGGVHAPAIAQTVWRPYLTTVSFKIKNAGFTVDGSFRGFKGELTFDPNALPASSLKGLVEVATINTDNTKRDNHLRSDDYFDAAKYKFIEINSKKLYKKGDGFAGLFNVTIKDKTKEVEIPFNFSTTGANGVFEGSFTIDRRDFGVGGNSLIMGDEVKVSIVVNAKK